MLTAIRVGNFKAFAESQQIPIRPITLIYGANSSGKSSAIHSLIFARHALESGELDIHRTNVGGDAVDLGGFRQYIHRRDVSRMMEWTAELDTTTFTGKLAERLAPVKKVSISVSIGITLDEHGRPLPDAQPDVRTYEIQGDGVSLLRMSKRPDGKLQLDRLNHEHPVFRGVIKAIIETSTTTEAVLSSDYEGLEEVISNVVPQITAMAEKYLPEGLDESDAFNPGGQASLFPVSRGRRKEDLAAAVSFFVPRTIDEIIGGVRQAISQELLKLQYLGPLRSYPPRHLAFSQHHDPNWHAGGGFAWDVLRRNDSVREKVNNWLSAPERLQTRYKIDMRTLCDIEELRDPLADAAYNYDMKSREYFLRDVRAILSISGLSETNQKEIISEILNRHQDLELDDALMEDFNSTEELPFLIDQASKGIDGLGVLSFIDMRSNSVVSHRDIGIGVSQVLPVLVEAYASEGQIIAIEQPEIHLHPALQADLGDVFIESALGARKNKFVLETHSEHLILRILRRIRETNEKTLGTDMVPIKPEDVSLLYVLSEKSGSEIIQIPITEDGEFGMSWPNGFFPERAKELF